MAGAPAPPGGLSRILPRSSGGRMPQPLSGSACLAALSSGAHRPRAAVAHRSPRVSGYARHTFASYDLLWLGADYIEQDLAHQRRRARGPARHDPRPHGARAAGELHRRGQQQDSRPDRDLRRRHLVQRSESNPREARVRRPSDPDPRRGLPAVPPPLQLLHRDEGARDRRSHGGAAARPDGALPAAEAGCEAVEGAHPVVQRREPAEIHGLVLSR